VCRGGDVSCVLCFMLFSQGTRCAGEVMSVVSCVVCCSAMVPGVQARWPLKPITPCAVSVLLTTPRLAVSFVAHYSLYFYVLVMATL